MAPDELAQRRTQLCDRLTAVPARRPTTRWLVEVRRRQELLKLLRTVHSLDTSLRPKESHHAAWLIHLLTDHMADDEASVRELSRDA